MRGSPTSHLVHVIHGQYDISLPPAAVDSFLSTDPACDKATEHLFERQIKTRWQKCKVGFICYNPLIADTHNQSIKIWMVTQTGKDLSYVRQH